MTFVSVLTFAHVLAAVVWVGGQFAISWLFRRPAGVLGALAEAAEQVAAAAWVAYAVLWATGLVNLVAAGGASQEERYGGLASRGVV